MMADDGGAEIKAKADAASKAESIALTTHAEPPGKQGERGENPIDPTLSPPPESLVATGITPVTPIFPIPHDPEIAQWVAILDDDALELFNERAGIREFEGGMSRAEAESAAQQDVLRWLRQRQTPSS